MQRPKVVFFDLNHTVFQMTDIPGEEIAAYLTHIKYQYWLPLKLPDSWRTLPIWNDAITAIWNLRMYKGVKCVTLSNNPIDVQIDQASHAKVSWDWMVPLECYKIFKPHQMTYKIACALLKVAPQDALMVTANKDFGDIEGAASIGMPSVWIDRKNENPAYKIKNLIRLVEDME